MSTDDLGHRPVHAQVAQHVGAQLGVTTDRLPILLRERAALLHDSIRQAKPSDVVQQPSQPDMQHLLARMPG